MLRLQYEKRVKILMVIKTASLTWVHFSSVQSVLHENPSVFIRVYKSSYAEAVTF